MKNNPIKSSHGGKGAGAGRPKGSANKFTHDVKSAILAAFDEVGGSRYLADVARNQPGVFCSLLGKVLPTMIAGDPQNQLVLDIRRIERVVVDSKASGVTRVRGEPTPRSSDPVVVTTEKVMVTAPEVATRKDAREVDRRKGSRAEYTRSYRARKRAL